MLVVSPAALLGPSRVRKIDTVSTIRERWVARIRIGCDSIVAQTSGQFVHLFFELGNASVGLFGALFRRRGRHANLFRLETTFARTCL